MDHVLVDVDTNVEEMYTGGGSRVSMSFMIPIEAKLRSLGVKLLYEVCRVQKFSVQDLRELCYLCFSDFLCSAFNGSFFFFTSGLGMFNDDFIDHLFDLVEQTRGMYDETFNYSVIKLIVRALRLFQFIMLIEHVHWNELGIAQRTIHGCFSIS
jgi:hypothetical protein